MLAPQDMASDAWICFLTWRICFYYVEAVFFCLEPFFWFVHYICLNFGRTFSLSHQHIASLNQDTLTRSLFLVPTWKPKKALPETKTGLVFKVRFNLKALLLLDQTLQLNWDTSLPSLWKRMRTAWYSTGYCLWGGCLFI